MPTTKLPPESPWKARVWAEFRAGNLTRAYRDVLLTLRSFRGRDGACWPSHETVADRMRGSAKTVWRALQRARELGLVEWAERRIRRGWRWLRTSNAYRMILPDTPVAHRSEVLSHCGTKLPPATNGHSVCGDKQEEKQEDARQGHHATLAEMVREAGNLPDLLKLRRDRVAKMLAVGRGREAMAG
jgi:hypothetical protein